MKIEINPKDFKRYISAYFAGGWRHFLRVSLQGIFWLIPIIVVTFVIAWVYDKTDALTGAIYTFLGFNPENITFLWTISGVALLFVVTYMVGHFVETRLGHFFENIFSKVPGYSIVKEVVSIFNSSQKGDKQVLVVIIKGFIGNRSGYNVGLMYSLKESILKGHYTVSLNMSPLPNGGFMFEIPAEDIFIIKGASFDHNLQYLLAMGSKPLSEIIGTEVAELGSENLPSLKTYLEQRSNTKDTK